MGYHDTDAEIKCVMDHVAGLGHTAVLAKHWADGAKGAKDLAAQIVAAAEKNPSGNFKFQYADELPLLEKIRAVCQNVYGAADIEADQPIKNKLAKWDKEYPGFPVCIAKTQMSFSTDPAKRGAPSGHVVNVRAVRCCRVWRHYDDARLAQSSRGRVNRRRCQRCHLWVVLDFRLAIPLGFAEHSNFWRSKTRAAGLFRTTSCDHVPGIVAVSFFCFLLFVKTLCATRCTFFCQN